MKQFVVVLSLALLSFSVSAVVLNRGRTKRIINGQILHEDGDYSTFHYVNFRRVWGCTMDQSEHLFRIHDDCHQIPLCGGSLIYPDMVLTACHCVSHDDFFLTAQDQEVGHVRWSYRPHPIFSQIMIFAGSANFFNSRQKRHAFRVFHHTLCDNKNQKRQKSKPDHDVALVQTCEPFELDKHVRLAPLKPFEEWENHFSQIVNRGAACLYVGFGETEDAKHQVLTELVITPTEWLRYSWRHVDCLSACENKPVLKNKNCVMCSTNLGGVLSAAWAGDSGGPVMCDGYLAAVQSTSDFEELTNYTQQNEYPIHCLVQYLVPRHWRYLTKLNPGRYHPLNIDRRIQRWIHLESVNENHF